MIIKLSDIIREAMQAEKFPSVIRRIIRTRVDRISNGNVFSNWQLKLIILDKQNQMATSFTWVTRS